MSSVARNRFTPGQYLALERKADLRHEYLDGHIVERARSNQWHCLITGNITGVIGSQIRHRPCEVYAVDMRVCVAPTALYAYPDVVAVCGEPQCLDAELDTLLNPTLIAEVLSPSTEAFDRGEKFAYCRQMESLKEYVLIAQDRVRVERYTRRGDGWVLTEFRRLEDLLWLASIGCDVALSEVYAMVQFPGEETPGRV